MKVHEYAKENGTTVTDVLRAIKRLTPDTDITHAMHELPEDYVTLLNETGLDIPKPASKPWNANENPWALDMLSVVGKERRERSGFRLKWVAPDMVAKRLQQGYVVANRKDYDGLRDVLPGEESAAGSIIKRRELVLMELPIDLYEKRKEFFDRKIQNTSDGAIETAKRASRKVEAESGGGIRLTQSEYTQNRGK
jgi:hypothetical protein